MEGMRGFRFLGRRNGIRRYLIIVTILVVMVIGGIRIGYRDDDFRLVDGNTADQDNNVVIFEEDPKHGLWKGGENVDVGLEDKVDLGRISPDYGSEEDEYYIDNKDPVHHVQQDDSVNQQVTENQNQQQQHNSQNEFVVHSFDNREDNNNVFNRQSDPNIHQNDPINNQHKLQFNQQPDTVNQAAQHPQIVQEPKVQNDGTVKAKAAVAFHPESYYDSDDDTVDDNQEGNNQQITQKPAITHVITFSQYDSEEDADGAQSNLPNNADTIGNNVVPNVNLETADNAEAENSNLPLLVPNIVHFVWFGDNTMTFSQMLSVLSVHHFVKPEYIFYHCDSHPKGEWWQRVISIVSNIKVDIISPPKEIFGFQILTPKQQADVSKLQTLMTHGGIYLDTDVIVTKSLQPLRSYEFSIGYSQPGRFDSDIVISTHTSKFLQKWLVAYTQYSNTASDDFYSCVAPYRIYKQYPDQVHVVNKMSTPTAQNVNSLYKGDLDWTHHYAVHLWGRLHTQAIDLDAIKDSDTPYGKLVRLIYNKV